MDDFSAILADAFNNGTCVLLVLSKKRSRSDSSPDKVTVRPVNVENRTHYQLTLRQGVKESHENLTVDETVMRVRELLGEVFGHCHLYTTAADYSARAKPDGSCKIKMKPASKQTDVAQHDRTKNYLIPENVPCPFLTEIGVMTAAGKVRAAKRRKFRQINRFLEFVEDVLPALPAEGTLNVIDFGSGKSYLTFALHHLLTAVHSRDVDIVGLDRKADVVADCRRIANRLDCRGLRFQEGDIAEFETDSPVHLCVSLHACDTATDESLGKAVAWNSNVILAVPCCQHELAPQLHNETLQPLEEHGILKERFAALATDALRAQLLTAYGYDTQVIEFIDMEHTAKNLLIRAVRRTADAVPADAALAQYHMLREFLGIEHFSLERLLGTRS